MSVQHFFGEDADTTDPPPAPPIDEIRLGLRVVQRLAEALPPGEPGTAGLLVAIEHAHAVASAHPGRLK